MQHTHTLRRASGEKNLQTHSDFSVPNDPGAVEEIETGHVPQGLCGPRNRLLGGVAPTLVRDAHDLSKPDHARGLGMFSHGTSERPSGPLGSGLSGSAHRDCHNRRK